MLLIHKETKAIENQPWRSQNWLGDGWLEVPSGMYEIVLEHAPFIELTLETEDANGIMVERITAAKATQPILSDEELQHHQDEKQTLNNEILAEYLKTHPVIWQDGKEYGITQEDQSEISLNIMQYQMAVQAGFPAKLEWHAAHEECREFIMEELSMLAMLISETVYPLVKKNQTIKAEIYSAKTLKQLEAIEIVYP